MKPLLSDLIIIHITVIGVISFHTELFCLFLVSSNDVYPHSIVATIVTHDSLIFLVSIMND